MSTAALECDVWWARRADFHPALIGSLDADERARLRALVHEADRQRFVLGCAIARAVLGARYGVAPAAVRLDRTCDDCGRPHGKVRDAQGDPPVQMSVSHSGDCVAVAFCRAAAVGVDVERIGGDAPSAGVIRSVLADCEAALLERTAPAARAAAFVTYWVRKEAFVKATGAGLRAELTEIVVAPPDRPARLERGGPALLLDLAPPPGYAAALALLGATPALVRDHDARTLLGGLAMGAADDHGQEPASASSPGGIGWGASPHATNSASSMRHARRSPIGHPHTCAEHAHFASLPADLTSALTPVA